MVKRCSGFGWDEGKDHCRHLIYRRHRYKNVKYIDRLTLTDNLKPFGKGLGGANADGGYAWYAGI